MTFDDDHRRAALLRPQKPSAEDEGYPIHIDAAGVWLHEGAPIRRPALVRLFAQVLRRDDAGDYWLVTPVERGRITVADAPFIATAVDRSGADVVFGTNVGDQVRLDAAHPLRVVDDGGACGPRLYVTVRPGLEARLARPVYYHLVDLCAPRDGVLGVWSAGAFHALGAAA